MTRVPILSLIDTDLARFWSKIEIRGPDECWEWKAAQTGGYGILAILQDGRRRNIRAHRLAWWIATGHDPCEAFVCHHCDNPSCCNPAHLFLGTPADNMADMFQKERHMFGEQHVWSKLSDSDIPIIFDLYNGGLNASAIARRYGVDGETIRLVLHKRIWTHASRELNAEIRPRGGSTRLTWRQVDEIRSRYANGNTTIAALAREYKVVSTAVEYIIQGKTWRKKKNAS